MSDNIEVSLDPQNVQLSLGQSVEIAITVQNTSNVVDVFSLEIVGLEQSWWQLSLVQSSLFPGDTADALEVIFLQPDGSLSKAVEISPQAPSVVFRLDEAALQQGLSGWRINLKNNTDSGQADGTLSLTLSELK